MKAKFLRKKYPRFIYQKYSYAFEPTKSGAEGNLKISFLFEIPPDIKFKPTIIIKNIKNFKKKEVEKLDNLFFHLGLIEIPSYWKSTCSPKIEIRAGYLNKEQIQWWKKLIIKGLGQFFYENKINFRHPNFLTIKSCQTSNLGQISRERILAKPTRIQSTINLRNRFLLPVGGGKDSIVTLELLKKQGKEINAFVVNPNKFIKGVLRAAKIKNPIIVERKIDGKLLVLNQNGFLNGHTPITAVYSFLSILAAVLFNYKNIAFSNEKSADEGNVKYLGTTINHQWSKSSEFENMFKDYCQKYLIKEINYFSFLRKYTELEIAKIFSQYQQYFMIFSSCNAARAKKLKQRWCNQCPKCLFSYLIFYPFLEKNQIIKIFKEDLFEKKELLATMKGLLGKEKIKPFECVGAIKESRLAFKLSLKKAKKEGKIPYLLNKIKID